MAHLGFGTEPHRDETHDCFHQAWPFVLDRTKGVIESDASQPHLSVGMDVRGFVLEQGRNMTFGIYSVSLLIAIVQAIACALLLFFTTENSGANRLLSLLLVLIAASITPSAIGFAGAYDLYPWLAFAPLSVGLGFGPVLWLYTYRLLMGRLPSRWMLHLLPLIVQLGYYTLVFAQPVAWRTEWDRTVHLPLIARVETAAGLVSVVVYWILATRLSLRYCKAVAELVSDSANYSLRWLIGYIAAAACATGLWVVFELVSEFVGSLPYRAFFWLDLVAGLLAYWLGVSAYRYSARPWPAMSGRSMAPHPLAAPEASPAASPAASAAEAEDPESRWAEAADAIKHRMESDRLYLDPSLSLDSLARLMSSNTWDISRAINRGTGSSFNDFVNSYRVEHVKRLLADEAEQRTVLTIGLDSGFNSKTSFNRCFKTLAGMTPTQYRMLNRVSKS